METQQYILLAVGWYLTGFILWTITLYKITGQITIKDLFVSCLAGLLGPIIIACLVGAFIGILVDKIPDKVLYKKK